MNQILKDISPTKISNLLQDNVSNDIRNNDNVDNDDKDNKHVNNVEHLTLKELIDLIEQRFTSDKEKESFIAEELASSLSDRENLNYYKKVAKVHSMALLLECLSITKDAIRTEAIRTTPAKYFVGVLKRKTAKDGGE